MDELAEQFEEARPHLRAVAYRMLGSPSEAEDAVQEAWFRLSRSDAEAIENLRGWLTTVVGRVCLDMLRARREEPSDSLPEPIVVDVEGDPEHEALMAESVGLALLVVLETLSPAERLAFVLHDMFAVPFAEIAEILGRSPDSARQLASRARRRLPRRVAGRRLRAARRRPRSGGRVPCRHRAGTRAVRLGRGGRCSARARARQPVRAVRAVRRGERWSRRARGSSGEAPHGRGRLKGRRGANRVDRHYCGSRETASTHGPAQRLASVAYARACGTDC